MGAEWAGHGWRGPAGGGASSWQVPTPAPIALTEFNIVYVDKGRVRVRVRVRVRFNIVYVDKVRMIADRVVVGTGQ